MAGVAVSKASKSTDDQPSSAQRMVFERGTGGRHKAVLVVAASAIRPGRKGLVPLSWGSAARAESPEFGHRVARSGLRTGGQQANRVGAEITARARLEDNRDEDVAVAGDQRDHVKGAPRMNS